MVFKKTRKIKIGLDLGSSSVKIIKLVLNEQRPLLLNFVLKDIPFQHKDLSGLLKDGFDELGPNDSAIAISLSGQNVIARYVSVPLLTQDEFRSAVKFEAKKYIPFSLEEVYLDGYILKQDSSTNKMLVLITAAKKEYVDQRIKLAQDLGLKIGIVDIDSLALVNTFNFNGFEDESSGHKAIALLNIGASITSLNILEKTIPCLSRDIYLAGNNFTTKIAEDLGCDFKTAEELKKDAQKENLDKIKPSVEAVLSGLAQEVRSSFDYYESQGTLSVEKIFLTGGGSLISDLAQNLSSFLGIEVANWDPLNNFTFTEGLDVQKIKEKSAQFAVALGLALR